MKKIETTVTRTNGGLHSPRNFKEAKEMLENCSYKEPRLYHVCLIGSEQVNVYRELRKRLCARLRRKGVEVEWKGCLEDDEERGLHMHVFLLVDASESNPCNVINRRQNGWLWTTAAKMGLAYFINPPRGQIHRTNLGKKLNYASLPKSRPDKLADCIEWISYVYKRRSKPSMERIYFGSRKRRSRVSRKPTILLRPNPRAMFAEAEIYHKWEGLVDTRRFLGFARLSSRYAQLSLNQFEKLRGQLSA